MLSAPHPSACAAIRQSIAKAIVAYNQKCAPPALRCRPPAASGAVTKHMGERSAGSRL